MKITYTLLLVLLVAFTGFSQRATTRKAYKAYKNLFYAEAADLYQDVIDRTGGTQEDLINLADAYMHLKEYIDAELTYEKLFKINSAQSQLVIYNYAKVLAQNERYDLARKYFSIYHLDNRGKNFFDAYESINKFYRDSTNVTIKYLPVNSLQSDFGPVLYENGLVFSSNRKLSNGIRRVDGRNQTPFLDLYYLTDTVALRNKSVSDNVLAMVKSNLGNKRFSTDYTPETSNDSRTIGHYDAYYLPDKDAPTSTIEVIPFDKRINSKYHEGPLCFSKSYDTVFFTRNNYINGKTSKDIAHIARLEIFFATRNDKGKYEHVQKFPFNNPDYSLGHPALSPDSKRLYFVSDMPGGQGETDIYYCDIREHRFTEPVNAGSLVNTPGSEMFPSFNKDGSMFFSSDGHAGLGGLDIFKAEITNNIFQTPRNLRFPINSSKDDFGIISTDLHGGNGYFSSNRLRGRADDNLYSFIDNRPQRIIVKGVIKVKSTDEDGKTYIEPLQDAIVTLAPLGDKVKTDRTGAFEFLVNRGKLYTVTGEKEKVGKLQKEINFEKASATMSTFPMELVLDKTAPSEVKQVVK